MEKILTVLKGVWSLYEANVLDILGANNKKNQMRVNQAFDLKRQQALGRVPRSVDIDTDNPALDLEWAYYCAK